MILENSNQPYLFLNKQNNDIILLYCYADSLIELQYGNKYSIKPWKIKYKNLTTNIEKNIDTIKFYKDFGNVVVECNPHIINIKNKQYLYYNIGFNKGINFPIIYYLCRVEIDSDGILDNNTFELIYRCFSGTALDDDIIIFCNQINNFISIYNYKNEKLLNTIDYKTQKLISVLKINKIYNDNNFILTGMEENNTYVSLLLDENFEYIQHLSHNNNFVYKCSLLKDYLFVYTDRLSDDSTENRRLIIL
jgi:hypothetical protein